MVKNVVGGVAAVWILVGCASDAVGPAPGPPALLDVSTARDTLTFIGDTAQLVARVTDVKGATISDAALVWSSVNDSVVTVDTSGVVVGVGTGTTTVIGQVATLVDSVAITVIQVPALFSVTPPHKRFEAIAEQRQFHAVVSDRGGTPIPDLTFSWSTSDTTVATVTADGIVESVRNGVADISFDVGEAVGTFQVTVAAPVIFRRANVVPMDREVVLLDRDIATQAGVITAIGASGSVSIPGAMTIDAAGQYILPGLADMHIHFSCNTGRECRNDLFLFLAHGVTTVRSMWGSNFQLRVRDEIENAETLGPTLFVASPGMDGPGGSFESFTPLITSVVQARTVVQQYADAGYDFIKVYNNLADPVYSAIVEEAATRGLRVIGHKPFNVRFSRLIELGHWTAEHFLDYEQEAAPTGSIWSSDLELTTVRALAVDAAAAGLAATPTAAAFWSIRSEVPSYQATPSARYASPGIWDFSTNWLNGWQMTSTQRADRFRRQRDLTAILHDEGVPLLLGTDAGVRWVFPGSSIHFELAELVASGLSPYEALVTGTINAAKYLGAEGVSGVIDVGARADLVLLDGNPLDDIANVALQLGVMVRGVWLETDAIHERLEDIARLYGR